MKNYNKKYILRKKRETAHNKKFIHTQKPSQRAGGYGIGLSTISSIWKKQVDIKLFIHVHFKWVEKYYCFLHTLLGKKPPTILHIFSISHQTYTTKISKFTAHYPKSTIFEDMRRILHTIIINYPGNPYNENDSRSWRWWYHGTEQKEILRKKVYSKTSCLMFYIWSWVCYDTCKF